MKEYIFSINSGRCGSGYLAAILGTTEECTSFHEAYPNFAGDAIRKVNTLGFESTLEFQKKKIKFIINTATNKPVYADTTHIFIKSWYLAALKMLNNVKIIWLRRNQEDVIKSLIKLNSVPDKSLGARNWYLRTDYRYNVIKNVNARTDKQKCEWYIREIDARAMKFKKEHPNIPFKEVWLEELNDEIKVKKLLKELKLTPTEDTMKIIGTKINTKRKVKIGKNQKILKNVKWQLIKLNPIKNRNRIHIEGDGIYE